MKLTSLKRISELYGLIERTRAMELGMVAAAVVEVEQAGSMQDRIRREQTDAVYAALLVGDQADRALAQVQREAAEVRMQRLSSIQVEREALRNAARISHSEIRVQMEQVDSAAERARKLEELESSRRMQAMTDDRYVSRRAWLLRQNGRRGLDRVVDDCSAKPR